MSISSLKIPILGIFGPKMLITLRLELNLDWFNYAELNFDFGSEFNCSLKEYVDIMISVEGFSKQYTHPKKSLFTLKIMLGLSVKSIDNWWYWSLMNMDELPDLLDYSQ